MPMYAISVVPVIRQLMGMARQVWYADDVAAGGSLLQLKDWWSGLLSFGRHFGYHVNAAKTWLVVKYLASAQRIFDGSGIQITSAGWPYLGAAIGSQDYIRNYTFLNGLKVCLSYPRLLLLNLMLHMRFLHMGSPRNGNTFYELIHTLVISCPPLSLKFVNSFYLL